MFVVCEYKIGVSFDVLNCVELVLVKFNFWLFDWIKVFLGK